VHAALVTLTIGPQQAPAAANALVNDILPTVRSAPDRRLLAQTRAIAAGSAARGTLRTMAGTSQTEAIPRS
jgi:hypothetical protein